MDGKIFIVALQEFINSNFENLSPKIELEFYSGTNYPASLLKAGAFTPLKRYLQRGGQFLLSLSIIYKTNSADDKEKAFSWLNAIGTWLVQVSLPTIFRKSEYKSLPNINTLNLGDDFKAMSVDLVQTPIDITGQDSDGVALYQATFNLKFKAKGAMPWNV
jgi:hypothetical protein